MNDIKKSRKSNGSGYTYRVGNSWKTVIEVGGLRVTATNKSKQESRRLAKEKATKVSALNKGSVVGANKLTLNDFLLPWLDGEHKLKIAHSTYRRYRGIAVHYILPAMGNLQLQRISKQEIAQFLNSMVLNNVKARTRNQALALLSVAFSGATEAGIVDVNPTSGIRKATEDWKQIKPLTKDEVLKLLSGSNGTFMCARLHIAFAGLRQGEVLGLRWRNIDLDKGSVTIEEQVQRVEGKSTWVKLKSNMSVRTIYLSSASIEALKRHKAIIVEMRLKAGSSWNDQDLVFPNSHGGFLQQKVDHVRWKKALRDSGLELRRLHDARHTAGTLLFAEGEGIETIRRVLGHSSVGLTSRTYVHNAEEPLRRAAKTMDSIFSDKSDIA